MSDENLNHILEIPRIVLPVAAALLMLVAMIILRRRQKGRLTLWMVILAATWLTLWTFSYMSLAESQRLFDTQNSKILDQAMIYARSAEFSWHAANLVIISLAILIGIYFRGSSSEERAKRRG